MNLDSASTGAKRGRSPLYSRNASLSLSCRPSGRTATCSVPVRNARLRHREPSSFDRRGTPGREHDRRGKASSPRVRPHATWALCGTSRTQLARCMLVGHGSLERSCDEPPCLRNGPCLLGIAAPKLLWVLKAAAAGGGASLACASRRTVPPAQRQTRRCRKGLRLVRHASLREPPAAFWCVRNRGGTQR